MNLLLKTFMMIIALLNALHFCHGYVFVHLPTCWDDDVFGSSVLMLTL